MLKTGLILFPLRPILLYLISSERNHYSLSFLLTQAVTKFLQFCLSCVSWLHRYLVPTAWAPAWVQALVSSLICCSVSLVTPGDSDLPPPRPHCLSALTLLPECLLYLTDPTTSIIAQTLLKPCQWVCLLPRGWSPHGRDRIKCTYSLPLTPASSHLLVRSPCSSGLRILASH